ncbi:Non-specific serine/threonine protein kinase [Bertholletia excelsa]
MFLVYEYMHNGTLADQLYKIRGRNIYHFYDTFPLTWERRLNICLGVARGLAYLHAGTGRCFVHRDIKPSNILLDEDWRPKISDFGLSIDVSDGKSISHIAGTPGYLAPENVFACRVIDKADVYAFAVVMLEILSGRPVLGKDSISLVDSALQCINEGKLDSIIDPSLRGQVSDDCLKCFVQVAIKSLNHNPKERPTMSQVVWNLELALMCQQQGTIAKVLQGISVIPPRIDNRWWHMLWQGKGECHESGPSRDVDIQQLFSSTDQRQCRSCRSASTMYLKPLLNTTSLVVDRSFGSRSRDVHLKSPLAESTTQVEVGSSRSTSNGHLEPVSNSSTDIMSKNFGSRSSSNVHLKPPFVENSTLRQRTSSRSASDVHMKPLSGNTAQIVVKNLGTGPSRDVCMQQTFRESTIQKEVRSSKSASNVQLEPVSNNTMGIVDKDFGSRSLGDVHLKPPSAESTTQREGRSSKTVSDVHMKSLLESPTQIGDENIGIKFSRDMHMEPPFVESTINQSANKNLEGRSSRNGHCEPISNSTTEQHTFHFLTGERGAIRYYFDDGVVIGQDCSSKVYRTCIDRPNSKGNTEDGKKSRRHKKNPFTWSVAANWTTIRPWKAKKHISNLYMTTTSKSSSNVREIISQGGHCRVSMDQDSTEKVPRLKDMIDDDVEAINCSVPSQHHDETTISNKPCEDKIKSEKIANGLEISPNNGTAVHEKQTDIGSEEHGNEVELAMTDIVVATKEESKISYDRILHDKTMSHMFEIKATQGMECSKT